MNEYEILDINKIINNNLMGRNMNFIHRNNYYKITRDPKETLNELIVNGLIRTTLIGSNEFVKYSLEPIYIRYHDKIKKIKSLKSKSFISKECKEVKIYDILKDGIENDSKSHNIKFIVNRIYKYSKIDISGFLSKVSLLDAIILNSDRHMNNISLILDNKNKFSIAPIYDNGNSLDLKKSFCGGTYIDHEEQVYYTQKITQYKIVIDKNLYKKFEKENEKFVDELKIINRNIKKYIKYIEYK